MHIETLVSFTFRFFLVFILIFTTMSPKRKKAHTFTPWLHNQKICWQSSASFTNWIYMTAEHSKHNPSTDWWFTRSKSVSKSMTSNPKKATTMYFRYGRTKPNKREKKSSHGNISFRTNTLLASLCKYFVVNFVCIVFFFRLRLKLRSIFETC